MSKVANGYDHAFILDKQKIADKASIATVIAPEGELKMDVFYYHAFYTVLYRKFFGTE